MHILCKKTLSAGIHCRILLLAHISTELSYNTKKEGPHKKASLKKDIAAFCQIWISIFSPQLNWRTVTPALLNIQAAAMPDWL